MRNRDVRAGSFNNKKELIATIFDLPTLLMFTSEGKSCSSAGRRSQNSNSRSPDLVSETNASRVLCSSSKQTPDASTPFRFNSACKNFPNGSLPTLPTNAECVPSFASPTATFADAPPASFKKPGAPERGTPLFVETKSTSASPIQVISGDDFICLV